MVSSIPTAKAALVSIIAAALPTIQVSWNQPSNDDIANETVWVDDAVITDKPTIGQVSLREHYTLPIVIEVVDESFSAQGAEERVWTLTSSVMTAVRANASLQDTVTSAVMDSMRVGSDILPNGRYCGINIDVKVESRI